MTEFQVAEITAQYGMLVAEFMNNYASHLAIYLTLLFSYCIAMFAAAKKLDRTQLAIATVLFVFAAEFQILSMSRWVDATEVVMARVSELNPEESRRRPDLALTQVFGKFLWNAGIAACLLFAWRVRRAEAQEIAGPEE